VYKDDDVEKREATEPVSPPPSLSFFFSFPSKSRRPEVVPLFYVKRPGGKVQRKA